jgi:hypothetical protein
MTIQEIMDNYDGEFSAVEVFESRNNRKSFHTDQIQALDDSMYSLSDEALDYELMDKEDYNSTICANSSISFSDAYEDDDIVLVILVQPERELTYIHVGAPAPQYAINSIRKVLSAVSYSASELGYYFKEEMDANRITGDVILDPAFGESEACEVLETTADYMTNVEDYTGVDYSGDRLTYDAATATVEKTEPTRNW